MRSQYWKLGRTENMVPASTESLPAGFWYVRWHAREAVSVLAFFHNSQVTVDLTNPPVPWIDESIQEARPRYAVTILLICVTLWMKFRAQESLESILHHSSKHFQNAIGCCQGFQPQHLTQAVSNRVDTFLRCNSQLCQNLWTQNVTPRTMFQLF